MGTLSPCAQLARVSEVKIKAAVPFPERGDPVNVMYEGFDEVIREVYYGYHIVYYIITSNTFYSREYIHLYMTLFI